MRLFQVIAFEIFSFFLVVGSRFLPKRKTISGHTTPILLVHGYINHGNVWFISQRRLEKAGFSPIYTISLGHPFKSIAHYAEKVREKVLEIAKETGREELILIGHSMGGLVSSYYACQIAPQNTVKTVITLGSPFQGTPLARIGFGENARQMRTGSPFLADLKESMKRSNVAFHHIAAKRDQIVIPGSSALNGKGHLFDTGHAGLLYAKSVSDKILEILQMY